MSEKWKRRGRGWRLYYEVKWAGYALTDLQPAELLEETEALDRWEAYTKDVRSEEGRLPEGFRRDNP